MSNNLETILIEKCKQGDLQAFDQLMEMHQERVFNFAKRISGNYDEAADITQDAFLRAFSSIKSFRNEAAFTSWMYRIVKNIFLDKKRLADKAPTVSMDKHIATSEGDFQREFQDEKTATPEERLMQDEKNRLVQQLPMELPDHHRIPLVLYHMENKSYEEISAIINLPLGTVKSRISRARLAFAEKLKEHPELL
ncbi:MAG: sigma-70 family RNA polymerase sigma factor [Abditibacteriota bacterium]|nr:sigma-70 family RNA polymerase sigma factor [Abditibacteriota bacterium]